MRNILTKLTKTPIYSPNFARGVSEYQSALYRPSESLREASERKPERQDGRSGELYNGAPAEKRGKSA